MTSFKELLESNKLETTAKDYYNNHTAKGIPDYEILTKN